MVNKKGRGGGGVAAAAGTSAAGDSGGGGGVGGGVGGGDGSSSTGGTAATQPGVDQEKLQRLMRRADQVRVGGKGSARRKKVAVTSHAPATDDRRLQTAVKRVGLQHLPSVDEVTMFKADGTVLTFGAPRVQANVNANTYVLANGDKRPPQERRLEEALADENIVSQLGPENMAMAQQLLAQSHGGQGLAAAAGGARGGSSDPSGGGGGGGDDDDDDDDVPELVGDEDFEQAAKSST